MGNQHASATVLQLNQLRTVHAEMMETLGLSGAPRNGEKVVLQENNSNAVTIVYPLDDAKGREFFTGEMIDGKRQGKGFLLWRNGASYDGDWENDTFHGSWGTMKWPDERYYTGGWKRGMMDGVGVMVYKSPKHGELRYEGEWKAGQRHGKGKQTFGFNDSVARVSYEGEWEEGRREGQGVMLWKDGSVYIGEWRNGRREGYGVYYDAVANGGERYLGQWRADFKEDTEARLVDRFGNEYRGPFVQGKKHGEGLYVFKHGRKVPEMWVHGVKVESPEDRRALFRRFSFSFTSGTGLNKNRQPPIAPPVDGEEGMEEGVEQEGEEEEVKVPKKRQVQSLVVLCIEAVGMNPHLLKKLGVRPRRLKRKMSGHTIYLLNQSKKAATLAWQATVPREAKMKNEKQSACLYPSLQHASSSSPLTSMPALSPSSRRAAVVLPNDVLEPLSHFLYSREAVECARKEKKAQRKMKQQVNPRA